MRPRTLLLLCGGAITGILLVFQLDPCSPSRTLRYTFEKDTEGWLAIGPPGQTRTRLRVVPNPLGFPHGKRSLEVHYLVEKGELRGAFRKVDGLVGRALRARFQADRSTLVVVGLVEADGSTYQSAIEAESGEWQEAEAPFDRLTLSGESSDENGRLDLDQVRMLFISDAAGFVPDGGSGGRTLLVDEYAVVDARAPPWRRAQELATGALLSLEEGAEGWMPIPPPTGVEAQLGLSDRSGGSGEGERSLRLVYQLEPDKLAGVRGRAVRVDLQTHGDALLLIGFVEQGGSSYHLTVATEAGVWRRIEAPLADFSLSEDSSDENSRLDRAQVRTLFIADLAGFVPNGGARERALCIALREVVDEPAGASS